MEGFGEDILSSFKAHGIERVLITYDRDGAGDRAAEKLAPRLIAEDLQVLRVLFPAGMDANEYARKFTPTEQALALVLRQAEWVGGAPAAAAAEKEAPAPALAAA